MRALFFVALLGCSDSDPSFESVLNNGNKIGECEFSAWPYAGSHASVCAVACETDKAPQPATPAGAICPDNNGINARLVEFRGFVGTCAHVFGDAKTVQWYPCVCADDPERLPPCE